LSRKNPKTDLKKKGKVRGRRVKKKMGGGSQGKEETGYVKNEKFPIRKTGGRTEGLDGKPDEKKYGGEILKQGTLTSQGEGPPRIRRG